MLKPTIALVLSAAILFFVPQASLALDKTISDRDNAVRKIDVAGRQRMLTQKIAKSLCFASIGIGRDESLTEAVNASDLFAKSLIALREGDPDMGLLKETDGASIASLDAVYDTWTALYESVASAKGSTGAIDLKVIGAQSLEALAKAQAAVVALEGRYAQGIIDETLAVTVNVAGRQRMLIQKASKEFCMISAGVEEELNRDSLVKTLELFERETLGPALTEATNAGPISDETIQTVASMNNTLLSEMNKAVGMY